MLIRLAVQAIVFAVWAFFMFRTLFLLARRARQNSGATFPGVGAALTQWRIWLTSKEDKTRRRRLGLLTFFVLLTNVLSAL